MRFFDVGFKYRGGTMQDSDEPRHEAGSSPRSLLPATQMLGFCFYWAWVYLSFNASSSINPVLATHSHMVYVHLASMLCGVVCYGLIIAFSRKSCTLFASRRALFAAGAAMAAGTACYAFPGFDVFPLMIVGAVASGAASVWVVIFWGGLFSALSARNIIFATALSFLLSHVIYFIALCLPGTVAGALTSVLPLCATLLFPDSAAMKRYLDERCESFEEGAAAPVGGKNRWSQYALVPLSCLPWRVAFGLFVVMFVYGGARVYVAAFDGSLGQGGFERTAILAVVVVAAFVVWGALFQGENVSLGTVYKMMLPLLASALLMIAIFGEAYVDVAAPLMTAVNVTVEIISWILLADIARTTRTPAFIVFALGRMAVQAGMFSGQLSAWLLVDYVAPFAIASVFALMMVSGFMFSNQDTVLVFEAPTKREREEAERRLGSSLDDHLELVADAHGLTQREKEIFLLWVTGHGSKYIQETLVISSSTVKTHVRHIYEKCGVHNRAEIMKLLETGL